MKGSGDKGSWQLCHTGVTHQFLHSLSSSNTFYSAPAVHQELCEMLKRQRLYWPGSANSQGNGGERDLQIRWPRNPEEGQLTL